MMEQDSIPLPSSEEAKESYRYYMRTDPACRELLGSIETIDDPVTGRQMRIRESRVAMIRGAKPENLKPHTVYLDPHPHVRVAPADLRGWYQAKHEDRPGSRVRPCMTDAILTTPYAGACIVNCNFCYLTFGTRGYKGTGLATVPVNYGEAVRQQLKKMNVSAAGYFSSYTDPFLPLETWYHNTQKGATAFVDAGLPIFFLSRLAYPDWAIDLMRRNPYSYAQKSIQTCDPEDYQTFSPGALPLLDHMEEIRKLRAAGVYVSIQCNPVVPGITSHEEIELLFDMLAEAGANHVIVKFVEANNPAAGAMKAKMVRDFGANRAAGFSELFIENCSGNQKTITEEYRREGHERYRRKATAVGMTYSLCYEYTKKDGRWISMGPEFITSEQCHGQRVPMHVKIGDQFKPLGACPPSGCLSCADDTDDGKGKCGSDLLGQAKALKLSDMRKPFDGVTVTEDGGWR